MWLARIFRVLSCLIKKRVFFVSLFLRNLACPIPRSFHSLLSLSYRYILHFLHTSRQSIPANISQHEDVLHVLQSPETPALSASSKQMNLKLWKGARGERFRL
jgi:hypothetical protein